MEDTSAISMSADSWNDEDHRPGVTLKFVVVGGGISGTYGNCIANPIKGAYLAKGLQLPIHSEKLGMMSCYWRRATGRQR